MFFQNIDIMGDYLKETFNATDDELQYLQKLLDTRSIKCQSATKHTPYGTPSVIFDDFLYHGTLYHASNKKVLENLGIRHIVNVSDCELDKDIAENFNVLWVNVNDELKVDIKKYFEQTNQFLSSCKEKNEKALVHCQMGISRSSSVVLAYLMKYYHDSLIEAYEFLLGQRPIAAPNLSFFLQLIRYEKDLRDNCKINMNTTVE